VVTFEAKKLPIEHTSVDPGHVNENIAFQEKHIPSGCVVHLPATKRIGNALAREIISNPSHHLGFENISDQHESYAFHIREAVMKKASKINQGLILLTGMLANTPPAQKMLKDTFSGIDSQENIIIFLSSINSSIRLTALMTRSFGVLVKEAPGLLE
jgi:hypothetical protein